MADATLRSYLDQPSLFAGAHMPLTCDACGAPIVGEPPGHGVYVWARGDEVRREEAPLCDQCATAIGLAALAGFEVEEEEG